MKKIIKILLYELNYFQKMLHAGLKSLLKLFLVKEEKNYYEKITQVKQKYCKHQKISRLSSTKFYCSECGKVIKLLPQEISILTELLGIFLVGSIIYLLTRKD
ncbi:MAG: hypothetical protein ABDH23_05270 [Endomicrobiia bacterium]